MKVLSISSSWITNFAFLSLHTKISPSVEKTAALYGTKTIPIQDLLNLVAALLVLLPVMEDASLTR